MKQTKQLAEAVAELSRGTQVDETITAIGRTRSSCGIA